MLRLCQFAAADNPPVTLSDLALSTTKPQFQASCSPMYMSLIPGCKDIAFAFHPVPPPLTYVDCLMISFQLTENGVDHRYEIVTALAGQGRAPAQQDRRCPRGRAKTIRDYRIRARTEHV